MLMVVNSWERVVFGAYVEGRGKLDEVGSLLLPCESWGSDSGCEAWPEAHISTEPCQTKQQACLPAEAPHRSSNVRMNCLIPATGNSKVIFLPRAKGSFFRNQCLGAGEKTGQGLKALAAPARDPISVLTTQDRQLTTVPGCLTPSEHSRHLHSCTHTIKIKIDLFVRANVFLLLKPCQKHPSVRYKQN